MQTVNIKQSLWASAADVCYEHDIALYLEGKFRINLSHILGVLGGISNNYLMTHWINKKTDFKMARPIPKLFPARMRQSFGLDSNRIVSVASPRDRIYKENENDYM